MKIIHELQIKLYQTASYQSKWVLEKETLMALETAVTDYIEEAVSYQNDHDAQDLKEMITYGAIEEVIRALERSNDLYTAKEILASLNDYVNQK